jgi:hypothetical protein
MAVVLVWWAHPKTADRPMDPKLLSEVEALFPGQVEAVVRTGDEVSLALSEEPCPGSSQKVAVTMKRGKQTVQALAFSGRKFCVDLGRNHECLEPLVTGDGKVILTGSQSAWSEDDPRPIDGYRVVAHTLPP